MLTKNHTNNWSGMHTSAAKHLLIVYHSMTRGTEQMVQAVTQAASQVDGVNVDLRTANQTGAQELLLADGYVFATPENLGSMSGQMKDFFDRTYYGVLDQIQGRPYCGLICAGSDGRGAASQLARIVTGWRLKPIQETMIINVNAQTPERILAPKQLSPEQISECQNLCTLFATGLTLAVF
jgi:multimeric flavodoxin WrbA